MSDKRRIEFIDQDEEQNEIRGFSIRGIFSGSILTQARVVRQLPFVLYLTIVAVIYIGNRYHAERLVRKLNKLQVEVRDLSSEQITTASELMNIRRPSEVIKLVDKKKTGLKLPEKSPEVLTKNKKQL